ncbi:hypothetical protein BpHYR1_025913, partial [Brachionus plicatilis]
MLKYLLEIQLSNIKKMDGFLNLYVNIACEKCYEEHLVDDLRSILKYPWTQYCEDTKEEQYLNEINESWDDSSAMDIPTEIDDILNKAEQLLSQIKLSDSSNSKESKKILTKHPNSNNNTKIKKKDDSKNNLKSIEPKVKERNPVYMNAPYKTEPRKTFLRKIESASSSSSRPTEPIKISKCTNKTEPEKEKNTNLILVKKYVKSDSSQKIREKILPNQKNISFSKIAPLLELPSSIVNLLNFNNKYCNQISDSLKEKQKKISKKHSFIKKLELSCMEKNSKLLQNNSVISMKNSFKRANKIIEKIGNDLKTLEDKKNLEILIPLLKSKIFAKKINGLKIYLDDFFNFEIEKIEMLRLNDETFDNESDFLTNSEIDVLSKFSSIGYTNKEELLKY